MAASLVLTFFYAVGTVVILPTPQEALLGATAVAPGWAVILVGTLGRALGAYLLFLFGDRLQRRTSLEDWKEKPGRAQRWFSLTERWVTRWGAPALFFLLLIPGFPDTVFSYVLAIFGHRPVAFATSVALASAVRLSLGYFGIRLLIRP